MRVALSELHDLKIGEAPPQSTTVRRAVMLAPTLILLAVIPLYCLFVMTPFPSMLLQYSRQLNDENGASRSAVDVAAAVAVVEGEEEGEEKKCEVFRGKWVYHPNATVYYTNVTCSVISDQQNCMKFGRPDAEFLKWRWTPDDCELPPFDAAEFMEIVKGKSIAFVGDSLARNHMQSLLCLLSRVEQPEDISLRYSTDYNFKRWFFPSYNLTLATFWAPFLVKVEDSDGSARTTDGILSLYLDEPDPAWASDIHQFQHVIVSAGQWFFRPLVFYEKGQRIGCCSCQQDNVTEISRFQGYRMAFRTTFQTLLGLKNYQGVTFLRTFSPDHFENGAWNAGGSCERTRPYMPEEGKKWKWMDLEFYRTQVEEFREAERSAREMGLRMRLLDTTGAMLLRPDGHPNRRCIWTKCLAGRADCVHWCLPGPIDAWNELMLYVLKSELGPKLSKRKLQSSFV